MRPLLEKLVPLPLYSFNCTESIVPVFDCPFHFHPEYEITHIVASNGTRMIGDNIEEFRPGDLVMLGENLPHIYMNYAGQEFQKDHAHSQVLQFSRDCLGKGFFDIPEMTSIRSLLAQSARGLRFGPATTSTAIPLLNRLMKDKAGERIQRLLDLLQCLATAKDSKTLASYGYLPSIDHPDSQRLNRVFAFINENLQETINQQAVAKLLGMSASTFSRYFRNRTNMTFSRFVNEVRISHACKRLLETEETILAISQHSGFGNLSNFNRRFKELRGLPPSEFRHAMRNK